MKKVYGILGLLLAVCLFTAIENPTFVELAYNLQNVLRRTGEYGIISIGVAFVIITAGIDLSIGSIIGLTGVLLAIWLGATEESQGSTVLPITILAIGVQVAAVGLCLTVWRAARQRLGNGLAPFVKPGGALMGGAALVGVALLLPQAALPEWLRICVIVLWVVALSVELGLFHGLLITKLRLQPFIVTLCGLLIYRGLARHVADDSTQGFGTGYKELRSLALGKPFSMALLVLAAGVLVTLWYAWRLTRRRSTTGGGGVWPHLIGLGAGVALVVIGSSRFWHGLPAVFDGQAGLLSVPVDPDAIGMPAKVMFWIGVIAFVPSACWFFALTAMSGWRRILGPLALALVGVGVMVAPMMRFEHFLPPPEVGTLFGPFFKEELKFTDDWWFKAVWWAGFAIAGSGLAWLSVATLSGPARRARIAFSLTMISGIFTLVGLTAILEVLIPTPFLIMLGVAALAALFLNGTIYGRYLLALGNNEQAARFSGINTDRLVIAAYIICAGLAGLGALLFALDVNSIQPSSHGNFYELYAIAAAVLGGCSLRGGEGAILGVVLGAAVMRVLYNSINLQGIPTHLEFTIIGSVILIGVTVDELVKRVAARRRAAVEAKAGE